MTNVLIDSDIILDLYWERKPHCDFSEIVFSIIESKKIRGFVTSVILSNVYYLLRKKASHERVINELRRFLTIVDILPIPKSCIVNAMNSKFKEFEDALQNYACEANGNIDVILTRNHKDYKHSSLSVMSAEEFCQSFLS